MNAGRLDIQCSRVGLIYLQLAVGDLRDDLCVVVLNTAGRQNEYEGNEQKDEGHQAGDALAHTTLELGELEIFPDDVIRFGCFDHLTGKRQNTSRQTE